MAGLAAEQIIERIANANGAEPAVIRRKIEQFLLNIAADTAHPHPFLSAATLSGSKPDTDELVAALEYELYDAMMPVYPGWKWDGEGYRNIAKEQQST